jgi:hypothetical protein
MAELLWNVRESARDEIWFRTTDIVVPTPENEIVSQLGIGTRRMRVLNGAASRAQTLPLVSVKL